MNNALNTRTLPVGYIERAASTAIYSPQWAILYPALGLGNEVAELVEKIMLGKPAAEVLGELGDVNWYVSALARDARIGEEELVWEVLSPSFMTPSPANLQTLVRMLLAGAGNAQGHVKKALRDHDGDLDARRYGLIAELGMMLQAGEGVARAYGSTLDAVCAANLEKLASRAARNTLTGDGDVR